MDFDDARNFRSDAQRVGLLVPERDRRGGQRSFYLDLNQGQLYVVPKAEDVLKLVQLARKHAESESYGEHLAILALVARRFELSEARVSWHRPYHVSSDDAITWITMREWLKVNGHPYVPGVSGLSEK